MKHQLKFYPVGNGDCSLLKLDSGKTILFDFRHTCKCENENEPEIDLISQIEQDLDGKKEVDILIITHTDDDHICGLEDYFELRHAKKYQGDDRIKIKELWLPAYALVENVDDKSSTRQLLKKEGKHRLKEKEGVRIFSIINKLKDWLEEEDIDKSEIEHLLSYAGEVVSCSLTEDKDKVKVFCHAPFKADGDDEDRNCASIILHFTFLGSKYPIKYLSMGDPDCLVLSEIASKTKSKNNHEYLEWDIMSVPHHCSYGSINTEKGKTKTTPLDVNIDDLFKNGRLGCYMISSSKPILNEDSVQPPHFQAKNYYEDCLEDKDGQFLVTMETPNEINPLPLSFTIDEHGLHLNSFDKEEGENFYDDPPVQKRPTTFG